MIYLCILYILLVIISMLFIEISSDYVTRIKDPFPHPLYNTGNRTAIIISGQLRSANMTILGPGLYGSGKKNIRTFFGGDDPPTCIQSQLEFLIRPFAEYGGVDIFMYMPAAIGSKRDMNWTGNPSTYEPYPGDTRPCDLYSSSPIFASNTGNKVFCLVEEEKQLIDVFIDNDPMWLSYAFGPDGKHALLQQQYGIYAANLAAKEYAKKNLFQYRYKVRLRPDLAFIKTVSNPATEQFNCVGNCMPRLAYYPNYVIFGVSAEDSFNFGETREMDNILDRYMMLISQPFIFYQNLRSYTPQWNSESHLIGTMRDVFNVTLRPHNDYWMLKIRTNSYVRPQVHMHSMSQQWKQSLTHS